MAAEGGKVSAPGGQRGANGTRLALGLRRGRKRKSGGDVTAGGATEPGKEVEEAVTKELRFSNVHEIYEVVESGFDDYTFDNAWEDGTPKVSTTTRRHHRQQNTIKRCSLVTAIEAHYRAMAFAFGTMPSNLPVAHRVEHQGRIPVQYLDDEDDVEADEYSICLLYTSPSPRDVEESRMPSSA